MALAAAHGLLEPRRAPRLRRLRTEARRTSSRPTAAGSSASRASTSGRSGMPSSDGSSSRSGAPTRRRRCRSPGSRPRNGAACLSRAGFEVEAHYGWFDRSRYRGGEDSIWVVRRPERRPRPARPRRRRRPRLPRSPARAHRRLPSSSTRRPGRIASIRSHGSQTIVISNSAPPARTRWPTGQACTSSSRTVKFSRMRPGSTPTASR